MKCSQLVLHTELPDTQYKFRSSAFFLNNELCHIFVRVWQQNCPNEMLNSTRMTQDTDERKGGSFLVCTCQVISLISRPAGTIATLFHIFYQLREVCLSKLTPNTQSRFRHEYVMLLLWLATDNHHLAFLGLVDFQVFEQHLAKFASYCQDLASAGSALARLKLMVCHRLMVFEQSEKS